MSNLRVVGEIVDLQTLLGEGQALLETLATSGPNTCLALLLSPPSPLPAARPSSCVLWICLESRPNNGPGYHRTPWGGGKGRARGQGAQESRSQGGQESRSQGAQESTAALEQQKFGCSGQVFCLQSL